MSTFELVLFVFVCILGVYAMKWANAYGKREKSYFEKKALSDLEEMLENVKTDLVSYSVFCHGKNILTPNTLRKTDIENLKECIIQDVTKSTVGNGEIYLDPEYDLIVNTTKKEIHYSVGRGRVNVENALSNT